MPTDPSLDASAPSWGELRPPGGPRTLIRRVLPVVALCILIGWSLTRLRAVDSEPEFPRSPQPTALAPLVAPVAVNLDSAPRSADGLGELPGIDPRKFLATKVERLSGDTSVIEPIRMSAIRPRTVSLVNLWATWCEPCKSELPHLRAFFAENRLAFQWDAAIQFVALMVDDAMSTRAASRAFASRMPADTIFLVDRNLDGGVKPALGAIGMYPSELPVTLLLDCNRRVRWHRVGALVEVDMPAIARQIEALRQEDACRKPRPPDGGDAGPDEVPELLPLPENEAPTAEPELLPVPREAEVMARKLAAKPRAQPAAVVERTVRCDPNSAGECGDGCHNRGENCESCPQDVQCSDGEGCLPRGDQAPGCVVVGKIGAKR